MSAQGSFLSNQLSFERVRNAYQVKDQKLKAEFQQRGFSYPPQELLFISYKAEGELQIWVMEPNGEYRIFKSYDVCRKSGDFGPKRIQGDKQVPEGFYNINVFNPVSDFHLSLGISYPNRADRLNSSANDLGGDIYIHGDCVTVGCLPMTDNLIEDIYILSTHARNQGQSNIPIHLYPFKYNKLTEYIFYKEYPEHITFWENLKSEYNYFKENNRIRKINVDSFGNYTFN